MHACARHARPALLWRRVLSSLRLAPSRAHPRSSWRAHACAATQFCRSTPLDIRAWHALPEVRSCSSRRISLCRTACAQCRNVRDLQYVVSKGERPTRPARPRHLARRS
eukprot:4927298-Pleurochrysis_carterae.AAC.3